MRDSVIGTKTLPNALTLYLRSYTFHLFKCMHNLRRYAISGLALRVNETDEYKLRRELLSNMDVMVRPVMSSSDAVNVSFTLTVWTLSDLV